MLWGSPSSLMGRPGRKGMKVLHWILAELPANNQQCTVVQLVAKWVHQLGTGSSSSCGFAQTEDLWTKFMISVSATKSWAYNLPWSHKIIGTNTQRGTSSFWCWKPGRSSKKEAMIKVYHKYHLSVTVQLFDHFFLSFFLIFLAICGFWVPPPGTEPMLPVVEA